MIHYLGNSLVVREHVEHNVLSSFVKDVENLSGSFREEVSKDLALTSEVVVINFETGLILLTHFLQTNQFKRCIVPYFNQTKNL